MYQVAPGKNNVDTGVGGLFPPKSLKVQSECGVKLKDHIADHKQDSYQGLSGNCIFHSCMIDRMIDRKIKQHPEKRQMRRKNKVKDTQPFSGQIDHMADIQKTDQNHADRNYDINRHSRLLCKNVHFILT